MSPLYEDFVKANKQAANDLHSYFYVIGLKGLI